MPGPLSIVTYNICDGGQAHREEIAQVIAATGADVVLLNEADDEPTVEQLAQGLGMRHVWARGSGNKHIALLSRWPIREWKVYNRRPITQALLEAEVETGGGTMLRVYGVHLLPYFMFLPYELARRRSVAAILKVVREHADEPHLVLGDFNAVAAGDTADLSIFRPRIRQLMWLQANRMAHLALPQMQANGYTDCYRAMHPGEKGWTWMPALPSARLDYIYANPQMAARLVTCDVVTSPTAVGASDHFPLLARFKEGG